MKKFLLMLIILFFSCLKINSQVARPEEYNGILGCTIGVYPLSEYTSATPLFKWQAVQNATSYNLQVSVLTNFSDLALDENTTNNGFQVTKPLQSITLYYWRVRAINDRIGPFCNIYLFITLP